MNDAERWWDGFVKANPDLELPPANQVIRVVTKTDFLGIAVRVECTDQHDIMFELGWDELRARPLIWFAEGEQEGA